jgi:predicted glutamine amidotransferase
MCRMYAHRSAQPIAVAGMLLDARHALLAQSCRDWRCESHRDGWGIGYYEGEKPRVIRQPTAAADDPGFRDAARSIVSHTVIGHVRQASVGDRSIANTHAFAYGRWIFAHNGTVTGFDKLCARLVEEIDPDLRHQIGGTTDSEHVFFWLLSRLRQAGQTAEGPGRDLDALCRVLGEGIRTLDERSAATRPDEPTRLNFLLTDGALLVASRWKHTLYWTNRQGPFETAGTGTAGTGRSPGVAVASEAIGEEPWAEVPDGYVMTVDADFVVRWLKV